MFLMADELPTPDTMTPGANPVPPPAPPEPTPEASAPPEPAAAARTPPPEPPAVAEAAPEKTDNKHWYVVKVQSGREESIKEAIERRVKIEGLEEYFGQIVIPVEKVTELRSGKRYVKERKLYPGYLMVQVEYNENILYLFRETSGVGDFVGGSLNKPPQPMKPHEVEKMLALGGEGPKQDEKIKLRFDRGDRVKIRDGAFTGMEGEVKELLEAKAHVRVEVTIFGRPVSVELEYWQVEPV
jgi:transcriptional antiterminator NusG